MNFFVLLIRIDKNISNKDIEKEIAMSLSENTKQTKESVLYFL
jgi:hypothetical protein